MSEGGRKLASSATAEIQLVPSLKSCLVNLPSPLVSVLANADAIAQNVIVEIGLIADKSRPDSKSSASRPSLFFGWTGFQSQSRITPVVDKDGIQGSRGRRKEQDIGVVEIDAVGGRKLGIDNASRVTVTLHVNPPEAHTVNIEPLTADDWDILNQHAEFLELNFLAQVRVVQNPAISSDPSSRQPIILHLTATSTIAVKVVSIDPALDSSQPFIKVSPEAEVIVAPKSRRAAGQSGNKENRSITSKRSAGGRSTTSARQRYMREDDERRKPVFLRPLDRSVCADWLDEDEPNSADEGLRIWVSSQIALSTPLKGVQWVTVSKVRAAGLEEPQSPQGQTPEQDKPAHSVVARVYSWEDAPDNRHALLSSTLSCSLGSVGVVGGLIKIQPAPSQMPRTASIMKQLQADSNKSTTKEVIVKTLKIAPFLESSGAKSSSLSFGGQSKAEQEKAIQKIVSLFGRSEEEHSLFHGPLTHKMILPAEAGPSTTERWPGGILKFDPAPPTTQGNTTQPTPWLLGGERKLTIEVLPAISRPSELAQEVVGSELPDRPEVLVGVDSLISQTQSGLLHSSSIMITGGLGSGKTSIASQVLHTLREEYLFHTLYYPCRKLITDETRLSTIKETLQRLFARALWGARLGGRAVVVLDDVDKLCPVETELQVGNDNSRSRQISELLCSTVRKYCTRESGVVLLATAQAKESVNNVVIGGHVVRDILTIKAPNKDGRRKILEQIINHKPTITTNGTSSSPIAHHKLTSSIDHAWMNGSDSSGPASINGDTPDPTLDLLDIAGKTDGYHAGDLHLLISRARSESLIRSISTSPTSLAPPTLLPDDFTAALKGFTPASLRNVTLQSSTVSFSSIGGLTATRQTLLETLQYPTTYAPIFASCPLRLRSGLLLYGFPGCGKTLLASAVAGECGLNFISVKGPEILNKYIGASEKSVRDLFDRAEAARPCVLFFDEFDSIAPKRGHDSTGVTDRVVNQLLTQMDGAEGLSGVYVLAATSRPDLIDPALLRPGRLDKSLLCGMPGYEDRVDILRKVSGKLRLEAGLEGEEGLGIGEVARRTEGYSGADLQAVMYNAHLDAIHDVLGPEEVEGLGKKGGEEGKGNSRRDFTFFRMGEEEGEGRGTAAWAAERARIAARLKDMEIAKRRAREMRRKGEGEVKIVNGGEEKSQEPVIAWRHIEKSLGETRPSLSATERRRLERVYREFISGRSGDLKDGVQGTEIGGRTSLM
ncbi:Peroxisome biosynthesis protein PAS1-like protein [Elsinoe fawcettii]|nr:Peroxisome biosynthesis protein PAS1-like protein [Elsinoe fawcettii]